jgi:hypothetical protein
MNNPTTITREEARVETTVATELSKVSTTAFTLSATAIGCWAMAALFAGAGSSEGPLGLLHALITTITG